MSDIQTPDIPSLSSQTPSEVRRAFDALRGWLKSIKSQGGVATTEGIVGAVGEALPTGMGDFAIPLRLDGFEANGAFRTIDISWDRVSTNYRSFSHVEIWRNTVDDLGTAEKIGTTQANVFTDAPPVSSLSVTYYYWGRSISKTQVVGPFNATAGTPASTANDPEYVLDILSNSLDAVNETMAAPEIVFTADRFAIRRLTDAPGQAKYPFVVDATYGVVMDVALIRELTSTNIKAGSINADRINVDSLYAMVGEFGYLTSGSIAVGTFISNTTYEAGASGWMIHSDGTAEFRDIVARGDIEATSLKADSLNIVHAGHIADLSVDTFKLAGQAVTQTKTNYSGYFGALSSSWSTINETTFEQKNTDAPSPYPLLIFVSVSASALATGYILNILDDPGGE